MTRFTLLFATATLVALPLFAADDDRRRTPNRAERREARQDIESLIRDINSLDNQAAARQAGLAEAAKQAGVSRQTIEAQQKDHPRVGLAGVFLAQEIAKNSKKSPDEILRARTSGEKTWVEIARDNKQNVNALERKLGNIQDAMLAATGDRARVRGNQSAQTAQPAGDSPFDKTIQSVNALGQEPTARRAGLSAIARETELSREQVEQSSEQNKQLGLGDFFVAQHLASKTKKSVSELWNTHLSGKTWTEIAQANNENATQIERKLERVEDAMRGRAGRGDERERVRERERNQ